MACCAPQPFGVSEPRENWTWEPREISISSFDEGGASVTAEAPVRLPRGGLLVQTSIGAIQFGAPPETIKDILLAQPPLPTPSIYVVPDPLFCPLRHVNLGEVEFPSYFNFFQLSKRLTIVGPSAAIIKSLRVVLGETLRGPMQIDPEERRALPEAAVELLPDLAAEQVYFSGPNLGVDTLAHFLWFPDSEEEKEKVKSSSSSSSSELAFGDDDVLRLVMYREQQTYLLYDGAKLRARIGFSEFTTSPEPIREATLSSRSALTHSLGSPPFVPPSFGVTFLGTSHGFDPHGVCTGYILWINGRGVIVDPPPQSSQRLSEMGISQDMIEALILTHCHADHDAGTFQRLLYSASHTVMTTPTIMGSFLRKYSAILGIDIPLLEKTFVFCPVQIGEVTRLYGAELIFRYSLHTIPTIGFQVFYLGQSMAFSSDTFYHPEKIMEMQQRGILSPARAAQLCNFPWYSELVFHECGVPPIHTPISQLQALSPLIREHLYVMHASEADLKTSGLKIARSGIEHTLSLQGQTLPETDEQIVWRCVTRCPFLRGVPLQNATHILESPSVLRVPPDTVIISQGVLEDAPIFLIASGAVEISRDGEVLGVRSTYELLGEMACFGWHHRAATCTAKTDVILVQFSLHKFQYLIRGTSVSSQLRRLYDHNSPSVTLDRNPLLATLPILQRLELCSVIKPKRATAGDLIWSSSQPIRQLILISDGSFSLSVQAPDTVLLSDLLSSPSSSPLPSPRVVELGPGSWVGETRSLLQRGLHLTTLRARSDASYFSLSDQDAFSFFASNPRALFLFLRQIYTN